jgi:hypothetical protein
VNAPIPLDVTVAIITIRRQSPEFALRVRRRHLKERVGEGTL